MLFFYDFWLVFDTAGPEVYNETDPDPIKTLNVKYLGRIRRYIFNDPVPTTRRDGSEIPIANLK